MQDYAPDPYGDGNSSEQRYDGAREGVGAGSAPPDQLAGFNPSKTFGRPPRGVAPPCGYAPGNAETNPYLNMSNLYGAGGDSGDVVFDPGTGTWIAVSKHKHKNKKGGSSLPNPMMPGMPGMGFDMYGRPMMAPMMMPGSMPGAFPPMYPGMMPPQMAVAPSSSSKSSKKDIKREARKEMKKMLKKEKEEEEKRLEKEARKRRKEMERQWQADEAREQEQRQAERRRMEEEARARAIDDARQKLAREAAERDAMERERSQQQREEAARVAQQHELRKRAAHEERMKAKWEAKEREERLAEARSQERNEQARRQQALAGIEEAARRGAHSPTSSRNSWLSESKRVLPYRQHDEDAEEELYDQTSAYDRSPRPSSPQSYRSNPPAYRSHPPSRNPSNDDYDEEEHDATQDWLANSRSDARSVRSASSSQRYLHPDGRYLPQGNPYQDHYHQRPHANSSSQLEARSAYDTNDTRSVRSAQSSRSRAPSVAASSRSDGAYRSRSERDDSRRPNYGRAGTSVDSGSSSFRASSEGETSAFLHPNRPQASRSQSQPEPHRGSSDHQNHHHKEKHHHSQRGEGSSSSPAETDDIGDWDFDDDGTTPTASKSKKSNTTTTNSKPSLLSSAMQNMRVSSSSSKSVPNKKPSSSLVIDEEDDDDEAIYVRSRSLTTSMQSSLLSANDYCTNDDGRSTRSGRSARSYVSDDVRSTRSGRSGYSASASSRPMQR